MNFFYRHRVIFGFVSILLAVAFTFGLCFVALAQSAAETRRITVVIDAGHGGIDGGVTGINSGVKESDINLALSRVLQEKLENAGLNVVQTRLTESGLYGAATSGYNRREMEKRAEIIRSSAPALVISVHQNFFSLSSRRGAQVFFKPSSERSKTLACMIQSALNAMPECVKRTDPLAGDYYILNCSDYPSVIVECGFLSNGEDEALLLSEEYREKIAETVTAGALSFLSASANG